LCACLKFVSFYGMCEISDLEDICRQAQKCLKEMELTSQKLEKVADKNLTDKLMVRWTKALFIATGALAALTFAAVCIAYLESISHEQQKRIEEYQLTFAVFKSWEDAHDLVIRRRYYRVYQLFKSDDIGKDVKDKLVEDLDESNVLSATESMLTNTYPNGKFKHEGLKELIEPDLYLDYSNLFLDDNYQRQTNSIARAAAIQTEISNYRAVLIRVLNLYDIVEISKNSAVQNHLNIPAVDEFLFTISNRTSYLMPFITRYRASSNPTAWKALIEATRGRTNSPASGD
jgi:hypothetical protein